MPCVYTTPSGLCDGSSPLSKNEHYLPRALGNFRGYEPLVNRICDSCQQRFSQVEVVFARNSAEAFFREMVGRVGRKNNRGKNIFYEPTMGIPPLTVLGKAPGHNFEILWQPVNEQGCQPMSQLVFIADDGTALQLPFRRGITTLEGIRTTLRAKGFEGHQIVAISNSDEEAEEMKAVTDELAPEGKAADLAPVKEGDKVDGEMKAVISSEYLRAIAKIAFHFVLKFFTQFSGLEPEFDDVKRFIYLGEANRKIVEPSFHPFVRELQQGGRMKRWGHLLSAECSERGIEARMQFFAGPAVHPIVWQIHVGKNPARLVYHQSVGFGYLYFEDVGGEHHGEIVDLTPVERILIPSGSAMLRYLRR